MANGEEEYTYETDEAIGVYSDEGREELLEGDEISPEEEGFMQGYNNEDVAKCAFCHKPLLDPSTVVERIIDNKVYRFCSEECAEEFETEREL
ncbi:hypothetical protein J7K74_01800 [Candidatus Woesearchaeota archaeon]|nr:hypothetical protein [Candidatus Woesearchaeota archaeon]